MSYTNPEVTTFPREAMLRAQNEFDTPFFFYSEQRIRKNCARVRDTFKAHFPNVQPLFAVKANTHPAILRIIQDEGYGFDCSSLVELSVVRSIDGFGMYTSNYLSQNEVQLVVEEDNMLLNADDISTLDFVDPDHLPDILSFRVNPGITINSTIPSLQVAGNDAKFGVPYEHITDAYRHAQQMGITRFGIHMMTGSNEMDDSYFGSITERLFEIMAAIRDELGIEMEFMNIGGGLGVPYQPHQRSLDLERLVSRMRDVVNNQTKKFDYPEPQLYLEPGRYITADAGWIVAQVQARKSGYKEYLGLNVSTNAMPRPSIYDAYHHISALTAEGATETVNVVGQICENNDFFGKNRQLPHLEVGDAVVIHNCGAHAFVMSHNYNGTLRPAEVMWRADDSIKLIRRAETVDDYFSTIIN
jgi:diaminopimelate decarboxylase